MNRVRLQDPVLQQACERSTVRYEDLGLPLELTVWVDPGEVSCRSGRLKPIYGNNGFIFLCIKLFENCFNA